MTEHTHTHTGLKWALNRRLDPYKKSSRDTGPEGRMPQSACCCPVTELCPAVCSPMDCSTPAFPVLHYFPEFAQTHVHWISDAIQPSHPLLPPSPPAFYLSCFSDSLEKLQGLFQRVDFSHQVAKVLELQLQHQSFQWIIRVIPFRIDWFSSPCFPQDSQGSSPTPQFESINFLAFSLPYGPVLTSVHDYWRNHRARGRNWRNAAISKGTSRISSDCQKPESQDRCFPRACRGNGAQLTPLFQTPSFQNCERINSCCFEPLSLWSFVITALGSSSDDSCNRE